MGDYIKLISCDKKNYYVPKNVAELSEYIRKEIESNNYLIIKLYNNIEVERDQPLSLEFEDVTFEVLELLVEYLNTKVK